ncbi:HD domain-containing phosphohydrolase [Reinekea marinisedimentorum]|uniref:Putative nucleotidyltransferase with HDIG domain n=1 Tax=Reinekea marinisedimentorum TaxID=230495 RepID=A0A4R3ICX5_9GAMM|nr:HD domain-containing phosphohydrolase [Reinekea marinisedimentorum]TCS44045.1 putative nucleotidyltransferase with HDIG domain [Reinekea marinisedimentorum]
MKHSVSTLKTTRLTILAFTAIVIAVIAYAVVVLEQRYYDVSQQNAESIKREHIADIVNNAYATARYTFEHVRSDYSERIADHTETLTALLQGLPVSSQCRLINAYGRSNLRLTLLLQQGEQILCQQQSAWLTDLARDLNNPQSISREVMIDEQTKLTVLYSAETIDSITQTTIFRLFDTYAFANEDVYLWINQIEDFAGGEDYAIRVYHQNLPESVGQKLSTELTDIIGNKPYLEELNGINQSGETFIQYYFKKRSEDTFSQKVSFAKLFEPYNWVIASGIYVDDVEELVAIETATIHNEFIAVLVTLFVLIALLAIAVTVLISRLSRASLQRDKQTIELLHQKEDVENYRQVLFAMLDIVEKRDSYTAGHTRRVAAYAALVAKAMKVQQPELNVLYEAAILHDIGKVSTPDTILLKPGRLNNDEYTIIRNHVQYSYDFLKRISAFRAHAEIVRHHHERHDGQGYPAGLAGDEIPLLSQILIVVDAFDAMTSSRLYQQNMSLKDAINELIMLSGAQFSPQVVQAAVPVLKQHGVIETQTDQMQDSLDKVRMAYYFQDSLTGLYNQSFLGHVLAQNNNATCCYFLNITGFSDFNKRHGWHGGDKKLLELSHRLKTIFPYGTLFRVFGSDFLVVHAEHCETSKDELFEQLNLAKSGLQLRLFHMNLSTLNNPSIDDITHAIEIFMYQSLDS